MMPYDEALATRVRKFLNGPEVEERRMFGGLAFLVGGRMCCGIVGDELMARVPSDAYSATLRRAHVRPMDFTGKRLKGFVYVGANGLRSAAALRTWIASGRQVAEAAATPARAKRRGRRRR
jgi:TfoX/Sxy family transcriptional regulator of competence genes